MSLDGPTEGDVRGAVTHGAVPPRDTNNARSSSNNSKPKSQRKRRRFGSGQPRLSEPLLAGYHSDGASASTGNGASTGYGYGGSTGYGNGGSSGYGNGYANGGSTGYGVSGPLPPVPRPALSNRPRDDNALARSAPLPSQRLMSPRRAASSGAPARSADNRSDNSAEMYNSSRSVPENRSPFTPDNHDTMYHKLKYYSNLQKMAESARAQHDPDASPMPRWKPQLLPPPHVLPAYLFGLEDVTDKPQTSWATISSIVNTMLGTTIVALPYAFVQTGVALGVLIMCGVGLMACFTCILVVKHGRNQDTYTEFVRAHFGAATSYVAWLVGALVILGAAIVYHILMKMSINRIVDCVGKAAGSDLSFWSSDYGALLVLIIFPVTALKDLKILVKFNSFGFVFVWFCVVFIVFKGAQAFMRHDVLTADHPPAPPVPGEHPSTTVDLVASIAFGTMSGMASLAFFIHNVIHTIAKNSDPLVIKRDVVLGFTLAGGVYTLVGVMGAFGLAESSVHATQLDNILVVYSDTDWFAVAAQIAQVLQLLTVYPLLVLILRTQVFELLYRDAFPGRMPVIVLSVCVMGITLLFALFIPNVSGVMRFTGAIGGLVIVFVLPVLADVFSRRQRHKMKLVWWLVHGAILGCGIMSMVAQFVPKFSQG